MPRVIYNGKIYTADESRDGRSLVFEIGEGEKQELRIMDIGNRHLDVIPSYKYGYEDQCHVTDRLQKLVLKYPNLKDQILS